MDQLPAIADLALHADHVLKPRPTKAPRHKPGERFLKGPIPLGWLARAAQLPGKSLQVGILLWFFAGLRKRADVSPSGTELRHFGVTRHAKYRALRWLEDARLIAVARGTGRSPVVTILDAEEPA